MKVWVVMGNDYPVTVFDNELAANLYCKFQTKVNTLEMKTRNAGKVYWNAYEFPLLKEGPVE